MSIKQHISNHIFIYAILVCITIMIIASFYRFIIKNDYMVYYESTCDPYTESCFESCDKDCTYYKKVQKYAPDIYAECGKDIADCKLSEICLPSDKKCSITYCDTKIGEDCDTITGVAPLDEQNIIKNNI